MKAIIVDGNSIMVHFKDMNDYRIDRTKKFQLIEIIFIAICGIVSGADDYVSIEFWAEGNIDWLRKYFPLPHGTPSHDTFNRVFAQIDPDCFLACFMAWTGEIKKVIDAEKTIKIDGKTLRRSHDRSFGKGPLHLVSAWASGVCLTLGQVKTREKSNEITAIPELINMLDITGYTITIDAMGCQREIAKLIKSKGGDYLFALKSNHKDLFEAVSYLFEDAAKKDFKDLKHTIHKTLEKNHGRIEKRIVVSTDAIQGIVSKSDWAGVKSVVRVYSERTIDGETTCSTRYYLSSLPADAEKQASIIRSHWEIESMHWILDVTFNEDNSRIRKNHGPQNMALLRKLVLNLLKSDMEIKASIKNRRFKASFNHSYLEKLLSL